MSWVMGYEGNGREFFSFLSRFMDGRRWGNLGLTAFLCGRERHPFFSLYILASRTLELDVVRRCRCRCCCCADETRVCRAARRLFYTPQDDEHIDLGSFFFFRTSNSFRISNIEYIFLDFALNLHFCSTPCVRTTSSYLALPCFALSLPQPC